MTVCVLPDEMRELVHELESWEIQIDCTYKCMPCVLSRVDLRACSSQAREQTCELDTFSKDQQYAEFVQKCQDEKHDGSDGSDDSDDSDEKNSQTTRPYVFAGDWKKRKRAQKLSVSQLVISNEFEFVYAALPVNGMMH